MATDTRHLLISVPDGRLDVPFEELDRWAEHLTWCYRTLDVREGASIGVVDFGASPVGFLGSRHLTPGLGRGVAERLNGTTICLDASRERVTLVPSVLAQFPIDVLVVRDEVRPLLEAVCQGGGVDLGRLTLIDVVGLGSRGWGRMAPPWRRLLVVEATMLIAPQCPACGTMHLAPSQYQVDPESRRVTTAGNPPLSQVLPPAFAVQPPGCERGPEDWLLRGPDDEVAR